MRVAVLTDFLAGLGGTETLSVRIAVGLRSRGHDVRVLCPRSPSNRRWVRLLRSSGIPVSLGASERLFPDDRGARGRRSREALLDRLAARLIDTFFLRWSPDVVVANPMGPFLVTWMKSRRHQEIPVVGYEFSAADDRSGHWYPSELPDVINQLDVVLAGCKASRHGVKKHHGFAGRTEIIPPVLPESTPLSLPTDQSKLGCVARLCVEKGLDYLVAALPRMRERHREVSLDIYGDGYDRNRLQDLTRALGVDDLVTLAGSFDPVVGPGRIAAKHAIFIQPSLYESIPTAMLEAAALGRVIVASRVGGIPEFFAAGGQGALVEPASPIELADAVNALLRDPTQLASMGARNAAVVTEHYGGQRTLDKLEQILVSVVTTQPE